MLAVPLRLRDLTIGSLTIFSKKPGALTHDDRRLAQSLVDIATIGIVNERALRDSRIAQEQLQHALESRITIEQAKGALAVRHSTTPAEAFAMLRAYARSHRLTLVAVARQVIEDAPISSSRRCAGWRSDHKARRSTTSV